MQERIRSAKGYRALVAACAWAPSLMMIAPHAPASENDREYSAIAQMSAYHEGLAGIKIRHAWGFVDRLGRVAVEPQFDAISDFSEGLAAVSIDKKWGFVDTAGNLRVPMEYASVESFHQGLAAAERDGKWGYLAPDNQWAIAPRFERAHNFADGVAVVEDDRGHTLLIDRSGNTIKDFTPDFSINGWQRKFGVLVVEKKARPFLFNVDGRKLPLPAQAEGFDALGDGLLIIAKSGDGEVRYGAMDLQGRWAIEPSLKQLKPFRDGLAVAETSEGMGLIDTAGRFIAAPTYQSIGPIENGGFLARTKDTPARNDILDGRGRILVSSHCAHLALKQLGPWTVLRGCDDTWAIDKRGAPHRVPVQLPEIAQAGEYLLIQATAASTDPDTGRKLTPYVLLGPGGIVLTSDAPAVKGKYDWAMLIEGKGALFEANPGMLPIAMLIDGDRGLAVLTRDRQIVRKPEWRYDPRLLEYSQPGQAMDGPMLMKTETGWGAIDGHGNWAIAPAFGDLTPFSDGIAQGSLTGNDVAVGSNGNSAPIPEGYRFGGRTAPFQYFAARTDEAGQTTHIRYNLQTGEQSTAIVQQSERSADESHGGLVPADGNNKWGLRNSAGDWVVAAIYDKRPEPLIWHSTFMGWKTGNYRKSDRGWSDSSVGFISPTGQEVSKPAYLDITVQENTGLLRLTAPDSGSAGLMTADGKVLLPPDNDGLDYLDNGWFRVSQHERKGLANGRGEWIIEPGPYRFDDLQRIPYSRESIAGETALVDTAGRISTRSRPQATRDDNPAHWFSTVEEDDRGEDQTVYYGFDWKVRLRLPGRVGAGFSDGVVAIERSSAKGRRLVLANSRGRLSSPLPYAEVEPMIGGRAVVKQRVARKAGATEADDETYRYGYIDRNGKTILPAKYEYAENFSEERAVIVLKGNLGVIDANGRLILHSAWRCGKYPVLLDGHENIIWPKGEKQGC